jgi:hypothetical protein
MGGLGVITFLILFDASTAYATLFCIKYEAQAPPKKHPEPSVRETHYHPERGRRFIWRTNGTPFPRLIPVNIRDFITLA